VEFDGNAPIAAAVDAGDVAAGLINHYYLLRLRSEQGGSAAENYFFPVSDAGSLVMPSGAAVLASASHPRAAAEFVSFLLQPESQAYFANEVFEYPVVAGVVPPAGAPALDSLASPVIPVTDLAAVLDRATDLISEAGLL
jgi:iron(III) transport system substrate-binding protein